MNSAYIILSLGVVSVTAGTICQTYGSAREEGEPRKQALRRRFAIVLGPLLTAISVYFFWSAQQQLAQDDAAKPVVETYVDINKVLHIDNPGTIDIVDVRVDVTTYIMRSTETPEGHTRIVGIESFSKPSGPLVSGVSVSKAGGTSRLDLASSNLITIYNRVPDSDDQSSRTVYALRIQMRNAVTRERLIRLVVIGAFKGFPDAYGDLRNTGMGGGYETSLSTFRLRSLIKSHQVELFDDDPGAIGRE